MTMISFDTSLCLLADFAKALPSETVALDDADGRVLAAPIVALRNSPPFTVSAMDGYAVRDDDLNLPCSLAVIGKSFASGGLPPPLEPQSCLRVFTGAPVPAGADRIIVQEDVESDGIHAHFTEPLSNRRHIRLAGSDFGAGDILIDAGRALNPQCLVTVAAAGFAKIDVFRLPKVAILATGDELAAPGHSQNGSGKVPDSLSAALAAMTQRWHGQVVDRQILPDDRAQLQRAAEQAVERADVVIVTGGASVGEKDFAKEMFADLHLAFSKVAIRPGKPIWLGTVGKTVILGLPGNPTSAVVTARLYLAPLLFGLAGYKTDAAWNWKTMSVDVPLEAAGDRDTFLCAKSTDSGVVPLCQQDSAAQRSLANTEFLIHRRANAPSTHGGAAADVLPV